jgi:hypothetical protein
MTTSGYLLPLNQTALIVLCAKNEQIDIEITGTGKLILNIMYVMERHLHPNPDGYFIQ